MNDARNFRADLQRILGFSVVPGRGPIRNLDLTRERLHDWQRIASPPTTEERGGSSSPREVEDRLEDAKVARWALRASDEFTVLLRMLAEDLKATPNPALFANARRLARIVELATIPIDHSKLPEDEDPGCVSCARKNEKKGLSGHYEPVADRYAGKRLCLWCGQFAAANKGSWPPIEAVDIRSRQGAHAAGRWLARNGMRTQKKRKVA